MMKTVYSMVCVAHESLLFDFFMSQSLSKLKMSVVFLSDESEVRTCSCMEMPHLCARARWATHATSLA
jgi:hypothetical protein